MSKEIEVKYKIKNSKDILCLYNWLDKNAEIKHEKVQNDYYYESKKVPFIFEKDGITKADQWLRIRQEESGSSICFKRFYRDNSERTLYADEYETTIGDSNTINNIFEALGYGKIIEVCKQRKSWSYLEYEISIDYVKGLGYFVEIEFLGSVLEPIEIIRRKMKQIILDLGIEDFKEDEIGYPALLLNANRIM